MNCSMWVHGNAFTAPERPGGELITSPGDLKQVSDIAWTDVVGLRQGDGVRFRGKAGKSIWFHVPIPSPVLIPPGAARAYLERVFVLYVADEDVFVTDVHVWDARSRLQTFNLQGPEHPEGVTGDHADPPDHSFPGSFEPNVNMFELQRPPVYWGIGISVQVMFEHDNVIQFTAAGADFAV